MGGAFAGSDWAVFQGASEVAIPFMGLARASNAEKRPKRFQPVRVALKRGRVLRWILSYSPLRGCAFESALPAASFERNKYPSHLISDSLEGEGEEGGDGEECEGDEIIPREFLLQEGEREDDENGDRDDLLDDLELEA